MSFAQTIALRGLARGLIRDDLRVFHYSRGQRKDFVCGDLLALGNLKYLACVSVELRSWVRVATGPYREVGEKPQDSLSFVLSDGSNSANSSRRW